MSSFGAVLPGARMLLLVAALVASPATATDPGFCETVRVQTLDEEGNVHETHYYSTCPHLSAKEQFHTLEWAYHQGVPVVEYSDHNPTDCECLRYDRYIVDLDP